MAQQKEAAPSGIGGLVRYEEEKSKILIKPEYVFLAVAAIAEVELVLQGLILIAAAFGAILGLMVYWVYRNSASAKPREPKTVSVKALAEVPAQNASQMAHA